MRSIFAAFAALAALNAAAFDLQGHRGARGLLPENTLPSFQKALDLGVDTIECDMAITRDGVVVIHHDLWLNPDTTRGPDGKWLEQRGPAIAELTFEELQQYDVGPHQARHRLRARLSRAGPRRRHAHPATVRPLRPGEEVRQYEGRQFDCETKVSPFQRAATRRPEEFARIVIAEIRKAGMAARTMVQSFDWSTLQLIQSEAPEIRTMYLSSARSLEARTGPAASPLLAGFDPDDGGSIPRAVQGGGRAHLGAQPGLLTPALLAEARALGLVVIPWTVNDPPRS